uniref:peptidylprolyl isomerase n=1 Tax=Chaetoceros debilis TaxID=122233 RepID=A0A7S3V784_9STRA|mmetsp:Transcript_3661/g.5452  ORF Transcript_3661/g.5452 Transcript_3661/m.5452 type:complete len:171 (+) Transcript_3661:63-575(+)|eukprot:CAMPEP_0194124776 /NCGR_PEP_ID=MMETSP0150-20130528/59121_1 /TAXON_ID=122233 /ORGANISM="Chaetoceros debilis, Strain MM31A-1" /LENGTH=170 /DNA_ID=CAMNT_0038818559 /DNA_START=400 /DNA_END=912 /DNA_ORIENTATION=-
MPATSALSTAFALTAFFLCRSFMSVIAKSNEGYDLDSKAPIRVGVKKRAKTCDKKTVTGDRLSVHYSGTLYKDGKEFDSSITRGEPFNFRVGNQEVIEGWDKGLLHMCIGEKRKLTIPSDLAYGDTGSPPDIHPGATLVFEIELLDILEPSGEDDDMDLDYYEKSHFTEF